MLEISSGQSPISDQKKIQAIKISGDCPPLWRLVISVFIITIFQKWMGEKNEVCYWEKNASTFNVLLRIYFIFKKGPLKSYDMNPGKFH